MCYSVIVCFLIGRSAALKPLNGNAKEQLSLRLDQLDVFIYSGITYVPFISFMKNTL